MRSAENFQLIKDLAAVLGGEYGGAATYVAEPEPVVTIGARNSTNLDDFRSVDFRAGYTFELGDTELLTFVEVINLLAFKNPCCVEYTVRDDGTGGTFLDRDFDYWPRFVPNVGVLWRF